MSALRGRPGFSLVEIVVAMGLTLAVFAITLPFVRAQSRALGANAGRLDAEQTARYAQRVIDRDLRQASGVEGQPLIVYAGPMGIAFNANLLAPDSTDPAALEVLLGADSTLTEAWRVADAAPLSLSGRTYPASNYADASGALSRVETVSYFLHPDTVAGRSDLYRLFRRVNARDSVPLVRNILVPADSAFFSYYVESGDTLLRLAAASLPLYWDSSMSPSISAVGLAAAGSYRNRVDGEEYLRKVSWRVVLPNAGLLALATTNCGVAPTAPSGLTESKQTGSSGFFVRLAWNSSTDDNAGALDVTHYVVSVRLNVTPVQWKPVAIVPAMGNHSYRYEDHLPTLIGEVRYGVRAVDCGGAFSNIVEKTSGPVLSLP